MSDTGKAVDTFIALTQMFIELTWHHFPSWVGSETRLINVGRPMRVFRLPIHDDPPAYIAINKPPPMEVPIEEISLSRFGWRIVGTSIDGDYYCDVGGGEKSNAIAYYIYPKKRLPFDMLE